MPDSIGKYDLRHILGKGAMGIVYEGFDPIIGRRLAIKTVRLPDLAYIVMEFVDGTTLKHVLDRNERFELPEIIRMMRLLLAGLQYSHIRGVVHRDIKPANIMLTPDGELKIADFGIARIESSSLTQAGSMMGTPSYMSPEQFMGQTVDSRTDIYSAGVVLYQLLTGEKPFDGGLTAIMHKVLHTEPLPPSAIAVTVPIAFDAVVQKAMAKRPADRFATAAEFAGALQDAFAQKTGALPETLTDADATLVAPRAAAPASASAPQKSFPTRAVAGGAAAVLIAIAAVFLARQHPQPATQTLPPIAAAPIPAPPPTLPVPPAQRDASLQSTFGTLPCTLIGATGKAGKLTLTGLAGAGTPLVAYTAPLNALPSGISAQSTVQSFDGPYCAVLNTIRPYNVFLSKPGAELGLGLAGGITILQEGQQIIVKEKMPAYPGYLQTDFFAPNGTVRHLYPTATDKLTKLPAESRKILGDPAKGGASLQAAAPFGTSMIISIVTTTPLFPTLPPPTENASDYLLALREALQAAAAASPNLDVAAVQLITEPKH